MAKLIEPLCEGGSVTQRYHVVSALNEVFTNVVFHSGLGGLAMFSVFATREGDDLTVLVIDEGMPYDPVVVNTTDEMDHLDPMNLPEGGMGLLLVKRCMDDIAYRRDAHAEADGRECNILTMRKRLVAVER